MVKLIGPASDYTRHLVEQNKQWINAMENYGRKIKIAERGDLILVNSGIKTDVLNMKDVKHPSDVMKFFLNNARKNAMAAVEGLNRII